jgi:hypothetical protein
MLELLVVVAAIVFLAIGASSFFRTFLLVQEIFPAVFKEGLSSSHLVDTYVANSLTPARPRRWYLLYLGSIAIGAGLFATLFLLRHEFLPVVLFGGVSFIGATVTAVRWAKHKHRLQERRGDEMGQDSVHSPSQSVARACGIWFATALSVGFVLTQSPGFSFEVRLVPALAFWLPIGVLLDI